MALAAAIRRRNLAGAVELCQAEILRMVSLLAAKAQHPQVPAATPAILHYPEAIHHRAKGLILIPLRLPKGEGQHLLTQTRVDPEILRLRPKRIYLPCQEMTTMKHPWM